MPTVATSSGTVRGVTVAAASGRGVHRFLGIRYAAAPVGDLRWRAPAPVEPWGGTRDAMELAPAAPQRGAVESALPGFSPEGPASEDCLALNVWSPGLDGTRPVVVWLPGGAYLSGGTAQPVYDATRLADESDVVVVTVGYRLGALGFLAPEGDAVANCGLRDQLAALAWVREHASAFGGDPRRVTAMGESAGAGSLLHLLASPVWGDAFDRAIIQSGQPTTLATEAAVDVAGELARQLGLDAPDAARLREVPVERLLDAQQATAGAMLGRVGLMPFAPSIDDDVCDLPIVEAIGHGRGATVDVVLGTTRDELALFPDPRAASLDDDRMIRRIAALTPAIDPALVLAHYRAQLGAEASNGRIWDAIRTDAMMRAPSLRVARARTLAARSAATYVYRFDWEAPRLGAAHAVDVPFTFGTFDREGWADVVGYDERAERLGIEWRRAWARFAHVGDPGWAPYDIEGKTMVFGPDGTNEAEDVDATVTRCWMAD
jgi:para-nitrobenzyl esterase